MQKTLCLYNEIQQWCQSISQEIIDLNVSIFFNDVIEHFGPHLSQKNARFDLRKIFTASFHQKSGSIIVANRGVSLFCHSPFSHIPYITRHIACCVYKPDLGLEAVNIGLVGDIYSNDVVLRAESACPPSFLFGSQRCNCSYQWSSVRELAAHLNPIDPPQGLSCDAFEKWVQNQFEYREGKHISTFGKRGVVLMHLDSQAGMGSGYTEGEFVFDLYSRALMRQLGENTTEEIYHTSIKEGYAALGLPADGRKENREAGYRIPAILLEWLQTSRSIIILSNNHYKINQLELNGFDVKRVKSLGKISAAGQREAKQRGIDFNHLEMDGEEISFEEEISRLKKVFSML